MGGGLEEVTEPFTYSTTSHIRKHGPCGYADYASYRDWLRDEFTFRCVFCCKREQWDLVAGSWDIDHFVPQQVRPDRELDYENLLYVCHTCNLVKSKKLVLDPCQIGLGTCLEVHEDGTIDALNEYGQTLIETLKLNNNEHTRYRRLIIMTLRSLALHDIQIYKLWMRYPDNLPDLSSLKPPNGNIRPDGIINSFFARRTRGDLPEIY